MSPAEILEVLQNRLAREKVERGQAVASGDLQRVEQLDADIAGTQDSIEKLTNGS